MEKILLFEEIKVFSLMVFLEGNHKLKFLAEIYNAVRGGMGGWGVQLYCPLKKSIFFIVFIKAPSWSFPRLEYSSRTNLEDDTMPDPK